MAAKDFDKLTSALPLPVSADYHEYITSRMTLLQSRPEEVNAMAARGELLDVEISYRGVKVSPLDNSVPVQVSPLAELIYSMLPRPKITEILDEVNSWMMFTRHFSHIKNDIARPDTCLLPLISTTSLNLKEIEIHWHEVLHLATSIKQGTVTASLMLKKLASYPRQNGLAKALREIGRIERTLFMLDWFRDPALRRLSR